MAFHGHREADDFGDVAGAYGAAIDDLECPGCAELIAGQIVLAYKLLVYEGIARGTAVGQCLCINEFCAA